MRALQSDERGFTLIEILVAALIIVVAFTVLAAIFTGGQNLASADAVQAQLINVADQQLEQVHGLVQSSANGFDALALNSNPTVQSASLIQGTFRDPTQFVFNSAPKCLEIDANYDSLNSTTAQPYGSQPAGFTPWSNCGTYGEPLEVIPTAGALITESTGPTQACPLGSGIQSSTIYSPCTVTLNNTQFVVYTFVTDTYVGCGSGSTTISGTVTTATTAAAFSCAPVASGAVTAGSCTSAGGTGTFGTSITASTPCADARRVTVAVIPVTGQIHSQLARLTPVYLSSIFTNPIPSGSNQSGTSGIQLTVGL